jgi:hypothetical protein
MTDTPTALEGTNSPRGGSLDQTLPSDEQWASDFGTIRSLRTDLATVGLEEADLN